VTTATVTQVAAGRQRRRVPGCPAAWQGLVLAACGVAVVSALGPPAQAHEGRGDAGRGSGVVAGLPLPDRPTGRAPGRPAAPTVLVRPGDNLWSLAADRLPADADGLSVTAAWRRLYAANRATVGPDPDLIRPGQRLTLGTLGGRR
jgi:nucleoid-associated protein YgaU